MHNGKEGEKLTTLKKIRQALKSHQIDGLLITSPHNRRYVTGFTGSAGIVVITANEAFFITDFRYIEQAEEEAKQFKVINHEGKLLETLQDELGRLAIQRIGYEAEYMTMAEYTQYDDVLSSELIATAGIVEQLRKTKSREELAVLKKAASIADQAFEYILNHIKPGVREVDIANELEYFMRKKGASESSFETIVASGIRSSLPHGVASEKKIASGELVTLDFGALYKGYCSDITRTVAVGSISDELYKIYHIVLAAQEKAVAYIKPNMTGKEADALTRNYIREAGYGDYFGHSTGHGIGLEVHEGPTLSPRSDTVLQKNMVVTVEPGIYIPNVGGCRIEDDIVLTEDGNERLTLSSKELIQL